MIKETTRFREFYDFFLNKKSRLFVWMVFYCWMLNYAMEKHTKITCHGCQNFRPNHSHKKRKDNLEGSLVRVLFEGELVDTWRIPEPEDTSTQATEDTSTQNTSNVNIESTGKSKQLYLYLYDQLLGTLICPHFTVLILICFWLIMPGVRPVYKRSGRCYPSVRLWTCCTFSIYF